MKKYLALFTLLIVACGGGGATSTTVDPDAPERPILTITDEGGFRPVEWILNSPPRFVVTNKGRLLHQGPMVELYPGPLLPNIQVATVDDETMKQIMQYIEDVSLPAITGTSIDNDAAQFVADATNTVFTYLDPNGVSHSYSVYALGFDTQGEKKLINAQLTSLLELLDRTASTTNAGAYLPASIQVFAGTLQFPVDQQFANIKPWPLSSPFADIKEVIPGWKCLVVEGAEAATLLNVFSEANQITTWDEAGVELQLLPRGLMPGEKGCQEPGFSGG